jgi:hypothetical protein
MNSLNFPSHSSAPFTKTSTIAERGGYAGGVFEWLFGRLFGRGGNEVRGGANFMKLVLHFRNKCFEVLVEFDFFGPACTVGSPKKLSTMCVTS